MSWLKDILEENRRVVDSWPAWKKGAAMTRKEELELRASQWLAHHGDQRLTRPLAVLLQQVEREVLGNVIACTQRYQQFIFEQRQSLEFEAGFRGAARVMEDWVAAQVEDIMTCVDDKRELSKQIEQQSKEIERLQAVNNDCQREFRDAVDSYNSLEQETKALREALQDVVIRAQRIRERKAIVGVEASFIERVAQHALKEVP